MFNFIKMMAFYFLVGSFYYFDIETVDRCNEKSYNMFHKVRYGTKIQRKAWCYIMDYLKVLVEEIHSVVVATVDETGHPHTAVMDMMWEDGKTVYFLTADFILD